MLPEQLYHIYNRGNNSQLIFYSEKNYLFFIKKLRVHLSKHLEILAYTLMPNHFHLLVSTKRNFDQKAYSNDLRVLLSSYTRAINKQERRTGSLFQQNTKSKSLRVDQDGNYPFTCFHYIHQNPMKAGMVVKMEDWSYSSFLDFIGKRNGTLCNKEMAINLLDLPIKTQEFYKQSYDVVGFIE